MTADPDVDGVVELARLRAVEAACQALLLHRRITKGALTAALGTPAPEPTPESADGDYADADFGPAHFA